MPQSKRRGDPAPFEMDPGLAPDYRTVLEDVYQKHADAIDGPPRRPDTWAEATPVPCPEPTDQRHRFNRLKVWGVPYREALLVMDEDPAGERYRETEPLHFAERFLREADAGRRNTLVLAGDHGTGKTIASIHVMEVRPAQAMRYGGSWGHRHPMFRTGIDLVSLGLYDNAAVKADLAAAPVLVIDDLGREFMDGKGVYLAFMDWILDKRYGSAGLTVLTTNLTGEAFGERYGMRLYDRLRHRAVWYDCEGQSLRGNVPELD